MPEKEDIYSNLNMYVFTDRHVSHVKRVKRNFKKTKTKLKVLTNIDMLLMIEKRMGVEKCHAICRYLKSNNKHMKEIMKKVKNHNILSIGTKITFMDRQYH